MQPWDGLQHGGKNDQYEEGFDSGRGFAGFCCDMVFILPVLVFVLVCVLSLVAPNTLQGIIDFINGLL